MPQKTYQNIADIPNRRGEYVALARFKKNSGMVRIAIHTNQEFEPTELEKGFGFSVTTLDRNALLDVYYGFPTIKELLLAIPPRLQQIT